MHVVFNYSDLISSHRKSYDRMPSATGGLSRLQVQFGSRESLSGSLPPIVGSTSGQYSAKAYGTRRQYPQQGSHGVYHARLQFNVSKHNISLSTL